MGGNNVLFFLLLLFFSYPFRLTLLSCSITLMNHETNLFVVGHLQQNIGTAQEIPVLRIRD